MAKLIAPKHSEGPVNAGERFVIRYLEEKLPEDYLLVPNLVLPYKDHNSGNVRDLEYDLLVIAPHAIYHLELKDWRGRLEGNDHAWYLNNRERRNPFRTARFKTAVLATNLREKESKWRNAWVETAVVFCTDRIQLTDLEGEYAQSVFMPDPGLLKYLESPEQTSGRTSERRIAKVQEEIAHYLAGKSRKVSQQLVLDFEVAEVLEQGEWHVEYLARHIGAETGGHKRIRRFSLDLYHLDHAEKELEIRKFRHRYTAFRKVGRNPYILPVEFRFDPDTSYFYEITDHLEDASLRTLMDRETPTVGQKVEMIRHICSAVIALHAAGVIHRDIRPENIFIQNGYAFLGGFGKSFFYGRPEEKGYTVMPNLVEEDLDAYTAPELSEGDAGHYSDLYSLGVLIYELFAGELPFANVTELDQLGGSLPDYRLPAAVAPLAPGWVEKVVRQTIRLLPEERLGSAEALRDLVEVEIVTGEETAVLPGAGEVGYSYGALVFLEKIGRGGFSSVFKVKHDLHGREYALKLFNESAKIDSVIDEYRILSSLSHPNIVKYIYSDRLGNGQFFTLMELLDGESLTEYIGKNKRLSFARIFQLGEEIGEALVYLHKGGIYHRDIKPQNLFLEKEDRFVLIDFNVAAEAEENQDFVGTSLYLAPDLIRDRRHIDWDESADTFALGVALYELACQTHPWQGMVPRMSVAPLPPHRYEKRISPAFSDFLLKAVQPIKADRFPTAAEMLAALQAVGETGLKALPPSASVRKSALSTGAFVQGLVHAYSQSKFSNSGTRGLDEFARLTYIETKLDTELLQKIWGGAFKIVIITGNAGDGKTAFIQQLEKRAPDSVELPHGNGARFSIDGVPFQSNYDGSQDEGEQGNEQVLEAFFALLEGETDYQALPEGRVIAINEGRLMEFLDGKPQFRHLYDELEAYFYQEGGHRLPPGLAMVNLNLRSVVGGEVENGKPVDSIFRKQVRKIVDQEFWQDCATCPAAGHCPIRFNVQSLADPDSGEEVLARMELLLKTVHLQRELHITIRDLRSYISFWITRDQTCEDMLASSVKWQDPTTFLQHLYFNLSAPAMDSAEQDRLIRLVRNADIGQVGSPRADREIFFSPPKAGNFLDFSMRDHDLLEQIDLLQQSGGGGTTAFSVGERHQLVRRFQFFEEKSTEIRRIPYQSIAEFLTFFTESSEPASLKQAIATAFGLLEGCRNRELTNSNLVLSTGDSDDFSQAFRLIPLGEFEIVPDSKPELLDFLEYMPSRMLFRHRAHHQICLEIGLDTYELIFHIARGFSPSINDMRGRFVEMQIFKNLLSNLPYREVVLTEDGTDFFTIHADVSNMLHIKRLEA